MGLGTGRNSSKTINSLKKSFGQSFLTEEKMNTKQVDKFIRRRAEALIPATLPAGL